MCVCVCVHMERLGACYKFSLERGRVMESVGKCGGEGNGGGVVGVWW